MQRILANKQARLVAFLLTCLVIVFGVTSFATSRGGVVNPFAKNGGQVVWIDKDILKSELNLSETDSGGVQIAPGKPVLIAVCATEACESKRLNLAGVADKLGSAAEVFGLNPYKENFTRAVEAELLLPLVQRMFVVELAIEHATTYAEENKIALTEDVVLQIMQDPGFQQAARASANQLPLLQAAYPKFFLISGDGQLIAAQRGISTEQELVRFVTTSLAGK